MGKLLNPELHSPQIQNDNETNLPCSIIYSTYIYQDPTLYEAMLQILAANQWGKKDENPYSLGSCNLVAIEQNKQT